MKNVVRNLKIILIRKFKDFITFEVCVLVCSLYARLSRIANFWRMNRLGVYFSRVPCHASIPYDKYMDE